MEDKPTPTFTLSEHFLMSLIGCDERVFKRAMKRIEIIRKKFTELDIIVIPGEIEEDEGDEEEPNGVPVRLDLEEAQERPEVR